MKQRQQFFLLVLLALLICLNLSYAKRVALVIGNNNYQEATVLTNPVNDARDMGAVLEKLGFSVEVVEDVSTKNDFYRAVVNFRQKLAPEDIAFFYYSGHGVQIDGINYLIPTRAPMLSLSILKEESISVNYVLDEIQASGSSVNVLVLDACRNLPKLSAETKSVTKGLAEMERKSDSLVAFATAAGRTALDGLDGERNSPYVKRLLTLLQNPTLDLANVFIEAQIQVYEDTNGQ